MRTVFKHLTIAVFIAMQIEHVALAAPETGGSSAPLKANKIPKPVAELVARMTQKGDLNATVFLSASGLYGIAIEKDKYAQVLFTDANARTITVGVMLDAVTKQNIAQNYIAAHLPGRVDMMKAMEVASANEGATGLPGGATGAQSGETPPRLATKEEVTMAAATEGVVTVNGVKAARTIYAFIDPLCGYCAQAWTQLATMKDRAVNSYRIKWIPMTLGGSADQVASLMPDAEPARHAAIDKAMQGALKGVAVSPEEVTPDARKRAQINMKLSEQLRIKSTPTFLVETASGTFVRSEGFSSTTALLSTASIKP